MQIGLQAGDGGKFVCGIDSILQRPDCTVFSFGSNVRLNMIKLQNLL